jgi:hypothetical protein
MKRIILFSIFCFVMMGLNAQDSYIKGRMSFQAGMSRVEGEHYYNAFLVSGKHINYLTISGNYGVCKWLETGVYLGHHTFQSSPQIGEGPVVSKPAISYGLKAKAHVFPWFIEQPEFRFDLYIPANVGAIYYHALANPLRPPERGSEMHVSTGLGAAGYLTKNIGIYAEYLYTRPFRNLEYTYNETLKSRIFFGVSLKF